MGLKGKQVQEIMQQKDESGLHSRQSWEILVNLKEESVFLIPAAKTNRYTITTTKIIIINKIKKDRKKERKEGLQNQSREFSSNSTACSKKI